jgi:hypothetical protein
VTIKCDFDWGGFLLRESKIICPTCMQTLDNEFCSNLLHLFPDMRGFTEEEAKLHQEGLKKLFKPTGRNPFKKDNET